MAIAQVPTVTAPVLGDEAGDREPRRGAHFRQATSSIRIPRRSISPKVITVFIGRGLTLVVLVGQPSADPGNLAH